MSLRNQPTPFDLHCAQAVADHEALRKKQLKKARDAAKNETTNQPVVTSNIARPDRQSGMSLQDEDESYNTTLMEFQPMPERPALRVLNLLSRMGPPATPARAAFKTSDDALQSDPWRIGSRARIGTMAGTMLVKKAATTNTSARNALKTMGPEMLTHT
ncbi:hypothetical protein FRC00_010719 [Tulasnella sp. 408]|nr:hypothetical protein FRC00_010719 [Tulasnella sp. 408]